MYRVNWDGQRKTVRYLESYEIHQIHLFSWFLDNISDSRKMVTKDPIPKNYFALQRKLFKVIGISFEETESKSYRIYSRVFLFCTMVTYPFVRLSDALTLYDDMTELCNVLIYASIMIMGLVKCMLLFVNRKTVGRTLDLLERDVFAPNVERGGPKEAELVRRCIFNVNRQCILFMSSAYFGVSAGVAECVHSRLTSDDYHDWKLPIGTLTLFDITYSPNFEIACVYQTFCVVICITNLILCDMLITGILAHIATQCSLLQNNIRLMILNARKKMLKNPHLESVPWKYLKQILAETIGHHIKIMALAQTFENQFSYFVLVQFLTSSISLCFVMYYCSLMSVTDSSIVQYIGGGLDIAVQVFFYCYWGNEVTLESNAIVNACYEVDFISTDLRFQKGLVIMMQRGQRPLVLTAGKFTALSVQTYVWIVRASYSYFMVLRGIQ